MRFKPDEDDLNEGEQIVKAFSCKLFARIYLYFHSGLKKVYDLVEIRNVRNYSGKGNRPCLVVSVMRAGNNHLAYMDD